MIRGKPEQGGPSCWIYLETWKQMTRKMWMFYYNKIYLP